MDKLLVFLTLLSGTAIAGALIAICWALGYTSFWAVLASLVAGFSIAWPGAQIAVQGIRAAQSAREDQARSTRTDPTEWPAPKEQIMPFAPGGR
ncbi:hypothetical protein ACEWPL_013430 [Roseovarius sp. S1116L3]|uniref:hypothetical protein n=1 Tax=Roseovarius roseus TaxID=3342636 RepID=UPI00372B14E2